MASSAAFPFLRVPNALLRTVNPSAQDAADMTSPVFSSLDMLGLYMMLGTVLSNPAFTTANGGLQHLLLAHCRNKYFSLHGVWRSLLQNGWLFRTRIPSGTNRFHDYYTLSHAASINRTNGRASVEHLSRSAGMAFCTAYRPYQPPQEDFTMVYTAVLMDPSLSLAAKGLYAILARRIRLAHAIPDAPAISKASLRAVCGIGKNAFDAVFRELRRAGYLSLQRSWNASCGKLQYAYILYAAPNKMQIEIPMERASQGAVPQKHDQKTVTGAVNTPLAHRTTERPIIQAETAASIRQSVKEQIEYLVLQEFYPKERLHMIVSILTDARFLAQRHPTRQVPLGRDETDAATLLSRFSQLDSEDIRFVLDSYDTVVKTTKIHHIRRYLTTCLYHAKENLAMALDALRFPGMAAR